MFRAERFSATQKMCGLGSKIEEFYRKLKQLTGVKSCEYRQRFFIGSVFRPLIPHLTSRGFRQDLIKVAFVKVNYVSFLG